MRPYYSVLRSNHNVRSERLFLAPPACHSAILSVLHTVTKLAEAEVAQKKKARAAERAAERAQRERLAVEAYNAALREKNRSSGAQGGSPGSLEGRKLEGRKPVKGISARSSAALGALLRQRAGEA